MVRKTVGARQKPRAAIKLPSFKPARPPMVDSVDQSGNPTPDSDLANRLKEWQKTHGNGSAADYLAWFWLTHNKKMVEHSDFYYSWSIGSKLRVSFFFPHLSLAWIIDDTRTAKDGAAALLLLAKNVVSVQIVGGKVISDTNATLTAALNGESR